MELTISGTGITADSMLCICTDLKNRKVIMIQKLATISLLIVLVCATLSVGACNNTAPVGSITAIGTARTGPSNLGTVNIKGTGFNPNRIIQIQYTGVPNTNQPLNSVLSPTTDAQGKFDVTDSVSAPGTTGPTVDFQCDNADRQKTVIVSAHDVMDPGPNPTANVSAIPWCF